MTKNWSSCPLISDSDVSLDKTPTRSILKFRQATWDPPPGRASIVASRHDSSSDICKCCEHRKPAILESHPSKIFENSWNKSETLQFSFWHLNWFYNQQAWACICLSYLKAHWKEIDFCLVIVIFFIDFVNYWGQIEIGVFNWHKPWGGIIHFVLY